MTIYKMKLMPVISFFFPWRIEHYSCIIALSTIALLVYSESIILYAWLSIEFICTSITALSERSETSKHIGMILCRISATKRGNESAD